MSSLRRERARGRAESLAADHASTRTTAVAFRPLSSRKTKPDPRCPARS